MSPHFWRWLLVVTVLGWTTGAIARPADSGEQPEEESAEQQSPGPAVLAVPVRMFTDTDSIFSRVLRGWLANMPDRDLSVLESGLNQSATRPDVTTRGADEELMMGDMPLTDVNDQLQSSSPTNLPPSQVTLLPDDADIIFANRESSDSEDTENRYVNSSTPNKKQRIMTIQNQIMNYMGWSNQGPAPMIKSPTSSSGGPITSTQQREALRLMYENVNNFPSYPSDSYTEKTQSFYPICELPKHTNEELWNSKESMNLMFNISTQKVASGISVNINTAKLRLFKQLMICNSQTSNETEDFQNCQPALLEEAIKQTNSNLSTSAEVPLILEDKQIRVSVYAYTRSLKKKRVKRKILDSRMLPYYGDKWTEWNIRSAVKSWRRDPNRNYGLSIEVEDEDGNVLPALKFFRPMNCTGDAPLMTPKPIPGFLVEAIQYRGYSLTSTEANPNTSMSSLAAAMPVFDFNNVHRYPMVDVTTVEVPDSEAHNAMLYQHAKSAFEQNLAARVTQSGVSRTDDQSAEHRIRHNSRHKSNNSTEAETPATKVSNDGQDFRDQIIVQGIIQRSAKARHTEIPD